MKKILSIVAVISVIFSVSAVNAAESLKVGIRGIPKYLDHDGLLPGTGDPVPTKNAQTAVQTTNYNSLYNYGIGVKVWGLNEEDLPFTSYLGSSLINGSEFYGVMGITGELMGAEGPQCYHSTVNGIVVEDCTHDDVDTCKVYWDTTESVPGVVCDTDTEIGVSPTMRLSDMIAATFRTYMRIRTGMNSSGLSDSKYLYTVIAGDIHENDHNDMVELRSIVGKVDAMIRIYNANNGGYDIPLLTTKPILMEGVNSSGVTKDKTETFTNNATKKWSNVPMGYYTGGTYDPDNQKICTRAFPDDPNDPILVCAGGVYTNGTQGTQTEDVWFEPIYYHSVLSKYSSYSDCKGGVNCATGQYETASSDPATFLRKMMDIRKTQKTALDSIATANLQVPKPYPLGMDNSSRDKYLLYTPLMKLQHDSYEPIIERMPSNDVDGDYYGDQSGNYNRMNIMPMNLKAKAYYYPDSLQCIQQLYYGFSLLPRVLTFYNRNAFNEQRYDSNIDTVTERFNGFKQMLMEMKNLKYISDGTVDWANASVLPDLGDTWKPSGVNYDTSQYDKHGRYSVARYPKQVDWSGSNTNHTLMLVYRHDVGGSSSSDDIGATDGRRLIYTHANSDFVSVNVESSHIDPSSAFSTVYLLEPWKASDFLTPITPSNGVYSLQISETRPTIVIGVPSSNGTSQSTLQSYYKDSSVYDYTMRTPIKNTVGPVDQTNPVYTAGTTTYNLHDMRSTWAPSFDDDDATHPCGSSPTSDGCLKYQLLVGQNIRNAYYTYLNEGTYVDHNPPTLMGYGTGDINDDIGTCTVTVTSGGDTLIARNSKFFNILFKKHNLYFRYNLGGINNLVPADYSWAPVDSDGDKLIDGLTVTPPANFYRPDYHQWTTISGACPP